MTPRTLIPLLLGTLLACAPESEVDLIDDAPGDDGAETPSDDPTDVDVTEDDPAEPTTDDTGASTEDDDTPTDYVYEEDEIEPNLSLDEIQEGIEVGIAAVLDVDPAELHDAYQSIIDDPYTDVVENGGDCPYYLDYYLEDYGYFYWSDTCEASDGSEFSGYALSYNYEPFTSGYYDYSDYAYFSGNAALKDKDGYTFEASGYSSYYQISYYYDYYRYYYNYVTGSYLYDNPAYADTWIGKGLSVNLYTYATRYTDKTSVPGATSLTFYGSLSGVDGIINTMVMQDTYLYSSDLGSACELEPSGLISVRDSEGLWYDVEFQGPPYSGASVFPTDCDGCGHAYFRGQYMGDVCPDFSPLLDWEMRPW